MEMLSKVIDQISTNSSSLHEDETGILHNEISSVLDELMGNSEAIDGVMVSSSDGIAIGEHMRDGLDQHRFAAMSSALLALSDSLAKEGNKGITQNVLIEGEQGRVFLMHAGSSLLLTVFVQASTNLGISLAHANQAAEKIACVAEVLNYQS
jgi:predicted regulator of Ras-like GTPase activity (Roadblock/LC7/MglB family)